MAKKPRKFAPCKFLPYSHRENVREVEGQVRVYDVSSYADDYPYFLFSPIFAHGDIPVPGMPGTVSDSVEGIWQGLKVIRGRTAFHLFRGRGQKRGGKPSGHLYQGREIGLVEARLKIYKPAYEWMLANKIAPEVLELLVERAFAGVTQHFHDLGDNSDVNSTHDAWAHAALLVQYLNRLCAERA